MNGKYDGEAYIVESKNSISMLKQYVDKNNKVRELSNKSEILIYSDEEYFKFVGKNKKGEFYSIITY